MAERFAHDDERLEKQLVELDEHPEALVDATARDLYQELETLAQDLSRPVAVGPHEAEAACFRAVERARSLATETIGSARALGAGAGADLVEGTIVGQYRILAKLGQGGMGAVYKALHTRLDKVVALKLLPAGRLAGAAAVARFQREMKAVGKIDHPNLVRASDAGDADGVHYLVMEYVDGIDLAKLSQRRGALPIAAASELIRQAALGLQAAHQHGMVHRDIKPGNLMLARQKFDPPVVKVLDLGLALLADAADDTESSLTSAGQIMGTFDYMAPEQAGDSHAVDKRVDVYSLGAALFTLLTGRPLYHGPQYKTHIQKMRALAIEPIPPVRDLRPDVPAALAAVLDQMLAKERDQRYATAAQVAEALAPFAAGADLTDLLDDTARSAELAPALAPKPLRAPNRLLVFALSAGVLALLGGVFFIVTDNGTIEIETADENVRVSLLRNGAEIDILDGKSGKTWAFRTGTYTVKLKDDRDGLEIVVPDTFEMKRGGKHVVTIRKVQRPLAGKGPPLIHALQFDDPASRVEAPTFTYTGGHPLTVECWTNSDTGGGKRDMPLVLLRGVDLSLSNNRKWFFAGFDGDGKSVGVFANEKVKPGEWVHVAGVWDGKQVALFVNGVRQKTTQPLDSIGKNSAAVPLWVGNVAANSRRPMSAYLGLINEVRISRIVRYDNDFTPTKRFAPDKDTLALYHCDEGTGDKLTDASGNGHHGKIAGAKWAKVGG